MIFNKIRFNIKSIAVFNAVLSFIFGLLSFLAVESAYWAKFTYLHFEVKVGLFNLDYSDTENDHSGYVANYSCAAFHDMSDDNCHQLHTTRALTEGTLVFCLLSLSTNIVLADFSASLNRTALITRTLAMGSFFFLFFITIFSFCSSGSWKSFMGQ